MSFGLTQMFVNCSSMFKFRKRFTDFTHCLNSNICIINQGLYLYLCTHSKIITKRKTSQNRDGENI